MLPETIIACIASVAFFGGFGLTLAWGAWYSRDTDSTRKD
jgi:hypothetical protein